MSGDDQELSATARVMKDTIMEQCAPKKTAVVVESDNEDEKAVPKSKPRGSKSASSSQHPTHCAEDIMGATADDETVLDQVAARPMPDNSVGMDEGAEYAALLKFFC